MTTFFLIRLAWGGGGQKKVHVVFRGGLQNVHVKLLGGREGSKFWKKLLHSLWMTPNQFVVIPPATIVSSRNRFYLWLVNKKPRLKKPVWQTEIFAGTKKSPANRHQPPIKATIVVSSLSGKKDVHNQPKHIGYSSFTSFDICISTATITTWWRK